MKGEWFKDARFGMFIHFGVYSSLGGYYRDMETPWVSEWIMHKYRIGVAEYEKFASRFNPSHFDADEWVLAAKNAGMKYMVVTAKHHDGFAMFHSKYDRYNIVDMTKFGRDVMKELSESCARHGIRLGFYYSQDLDWHEAGATGNIWDFPVKTPEAFQKYLDTKVTCQLTELLTNYGDVSVIWFDMPVQITGKQSETLSSLVHRLQPDCLVSGRIGNGKGDYDSLGDNASPGEVPFERPTEGIGTMNESWGYKPYDKAYRSTRELLNVMARLVAHNANYMLNVGPDGSGRFPAPARKHLHEIGEFLKRNGEALYGAGACGQMHVPFLFRWGHMTAKDNHVYFWVLNPGHAGRIVFHGLRNKVVSSEILADGRKINFKETHRPEFNYNRLELPLPAGLRLPYVIRVSVESAPDFDPQAYYANGGPLIPPGGK